MNKKRFSIFLSALLCILLLSSNAHADLKIHMIDVGQGDAILVQCDGAAMLIDAGPEDAGITVNSYLTNTVGLSGLDVVIATHEHDDHLYGMPAALRRLSVETVYSSRAVSMSWWFTTVLPLLNQGGLTVLYPQPGDSFPLGGATVTFINPLTEAENPNDLSLVIRIDYGESSALLAGDAEAEAELSMLESGYPLHADILKIAHHGGNTSTSEAFLKAVSPSYALISVGTGNPHGHPHAEVLNHLLKQNVMVYRTDHFGTVVATSDGTEWSFEVTKAR